MSGHVLVSYGPSDHWYVSQLAAHLADVGISVVRDRLGADDGFDLREAIAASAGVVVVLTPRSAASDSIQNAISHASDLRKPILPLLLEPCPQQDIPKPITQLGLEHVVGGRMPGQTFIAKLLVLVEPTRAEPPDSAQSDPTTSELITRYTPVQPARAGDIPPEPSVSPVLDVPASLTETLVEPAETQRKRLGLVLPVVAGLVAAAGLVWALANQLPKSAEGAPHPRATPARTPTAAVSSFISAAEVRDDDAVNEYVCARYRGVTWYASDFFAPNFIEAKLVLVTAGGYSGIANLELTFQVDGDRRVKGVRYAVVSEGGAWKVCGPA